MVFSHLKGVEEDVGCPKILNSSEKFENLDLKC